MLSALPARFIPRRPLLALAITLLLAPGAGAAMPNGEPKGEPNGVPTLQVITITASAEQPVRQASTSASKLDLSLRETPQSVSVVTRQRMDDFRLDNANSVLANSTGVTVEQVETDRSYYAARGFDITNFQYDGVGLPFVFGNVLGDLDTALYERIDIVRGANGLSSSTGNPSATINFIRKRPSPAAQGSAALTLGSWDRRRLDADLSVPLNARASVRGRAVLAHQDSGSWLDRHHSNKKVAYAVVEADLAPGATFTLGHLYQQNDSRGGMWGALPLYYTDGSPTDYPGATSTSAKWSRWARLTNASFAEWRQALGRDWSVKAVVSHTSASSDAKLLYVYGTPDKASGAGLFAYPSVYGSHHRQQLLDIGASGTFMLGGRQHDLSFGVNAARSRLADQSLYGRGIGAALGPATSFTGTWPEPRFDASVDGSSYQDRRNSAYLAARLALGERSKLLAGVNATRVTASGISYGSSKQTRAGKGTPYLGLTHAIGQHATAYASYTEIFNPQSETGIDGATLAPVMGSSTELGVKSELLERKLLLTGAVFRTRQDNSAEQGGMVGNKSWYRGVNAASRGAELEAAGELSRGWNASAGLTLLSVKDSAGQAVRTYVPRKLLRVSSTYRLPLLPRLKVGATLNWQGATWRDQDQVGELHVVTRQGAYAVLGLMARYEISERTALAFNLHNATNHKHLTSLYWSQAYYAAPRHASATLSWTY